MRAWLAIVVMVLGCKAKEEAAPKPAPKPAPVADTPAAGQPVRKGTLKRREVASFAVIAPKGTPPETLENAARTAATKVGITVVAAPSPDDGEVVVFKRLALADIGWMPDQHMVYGDSAPAADLPRIEASTFVLGVVGSTASHRPTLIAQTAEIARAAAEACRGWIVDFDLHRFVPAEHLADYLPGPKPDARKHIMLHLVAGEGDLSFIDTDGMHRFGFPEIEVRDVPSAWMRQVASIINATAQTLIEGGDVARDGVLEVDLAALSGDWHRADVLAAKGTGTITWQATWSAGVDHEAADPSDLLLELSLPGSTPGDPTKLVAAIDRYMGPTPDEVHHFDYREELDAAAVEARAALTKLRPHFTKGIPSGERLSVKAPFTTDDGNGTEWMWVDIFKFTGGTLEGILNNDPDQVSALKVGARVKVKLAELADFIYYRADDSHEGGFSLAVMRKHGENVPDL